MAAYVLKKSEEKLISSLPRYLQRATAIPLQDISIPHVCQIFMQNDDRNWHINDYYIFTYCLRESKKLFIADQQITLKPGEAVILPPDIRHRFCSAAENSEVLLLCFYSSSGKEMMKKISGEKFVPNSGERKIIFDAVKAFEAFVDNQEASFHFAIAMYRIISRIFSDLPTEFHFEHSDPKIHQANLIIQANLHRKITLPWLAKSLSISVSTLQKSFYTKMKCSIGRYILNQRLSKASKLLRSGNMNFAEIAFVTGFESEITFRRAFKRETGYSPSRVRKIATGSVAPGVELKLNGFPVRKVFSDREDI